LPTSDATVVTKDCQALGGKTFIKGVYDGPYRHPRETGLARHLDHTVGFHVHHSGTAITGQGRFGGPVWHQVRRGDHGPLLHRQSFCFRCLKHLLHQPVICNIP
jgi:hypothetical protein